MPSGPRSFEHWFNVGFGSAIVVVFVVLVFRHYDSLTTPLIIRYLAAVAAALMSQAFLGRTVLKGSIRGLFISASGGIAVFLLVFFFWDPSSTFGASSGPAQASSRQIEVSGTILNAGQSVGRVRLDFQEIPAHIESDDKGFFRLRVPLVRSVHLQIEGFPHPFELQLADIKQSGYFRLDVAQPGVVLPFNQ